MSRDAGHVGGQMSELIIGSRNPLCSFPSLFVHNLLIVLGRSAASYDNHRIQTESSIHGLSQAFGLTISLKQSWDSTGSGHWLPKPAFRHGQREQYCSG